MATTDPPASQPSDNSVITTKIFTDSSGSPLKIYIDPGGILNRPKLVRALKNNGAFINKNPRDSDILLVDSSTSTGQQFIRDWSADQSKAVLEYGWVRESIDAGRTLLAGDRWGGFLTLYDELPVGDGSNEEGVQPHNSLPTPSPTPVEYRPPSRVDNCKSRSSSPTPTYARAPTSSPQTSISQTEFTYPPSSQTNLGISSSQSSIVGQQLPQQPISNGGIISSSVQPGQGGIMPYHPQMIINTVDTGVDSSFPGRPNQQAMNLQMAFMDSMKSHGLSLQGWTLPPSNVASSVHSPQLQTQLPDHLPPSTLNVSMTEDIPGVTSTDSVEFLSSPPASSSQVPPSSQHQQISESSSSPTSYLHSKSKDKGEDRNKGRGYRDRDRDGWIGKDKDDEQADSLDRSHTHHSSYITGATSSNTTKPSASPVSKTLLDKCFVTKAGNELFFFVQIDILQRLDLVTKIKKNGGKIANDVTLADYCILSPRSKSFDDLLKAAMSANKPALNASFVHASCEKKVLQDPSTYLFNDSDFKKKKRSRPSATASSEVQDAKKEKESRRREEMTQRKIERENKRAAKDQRIRADDKEGQTFGRPKSPTPPPESSQLRTPSGRYAFTAEEYDYAESYSRFLLERDPSIANSAIATRLTKKMPHHGSSWRNVMSKPGSKLRDQVNEMRKRARIMSRKADTQEQAHQVQMDGMDSSDNYGNESGPSKRQKRDPTPDESVIAENADSEKNDFDLMCHFFASGAGDNGEPDEVWDILLANKVTSLTRVLIALSLDKNVLLQGPCKSAPSWPEFYESHFDEVNEEIRSLAEVRVSEELRSEATFETAGG